MPVESRKLYLVVVLCFFKYWNVTLVRDFKEFEVSSH